MKSKEETDYINVKFCFSDVQARPERLISRLRTISLEDQGPRITVMRPPKGPDGSKGFSADARLKRAPGQTLYE